MAVITLGGNVGAGKSHVAKKLADTLGYKELHIGDLFREMASQEGLTIDEFYSQLKNDPVLERSVDARQEEFLKKNDNVIVQGRISWYFANSSPFRVLNVFLTADPATVAARIAGRPEYKDQPQEKIIRLAARRARPKSGHDIRRSTVSKIIWIRGTTIFLWTRRISRPIKLSRQYWKKDDC
ncbi:MAG: cytidylate kinase family protein [Candidatus Liptonbacteria bacterium]|nr:cytidylate kinase family protein [Candidatus Liptonbacteria bacterium]